MFEIGLHGEGSVIVDGQQSRLDSATYGAGGVWLLWVHGKGGTFAENAADLGEGEPGRVGREAPATAGAGLRGDEAGFAQGSHLTADEGRVGVDAAGDVLRGHRLLWLRGEQREDVQGNRKSGADIHRILSLLWDAEEVKRGAIFRGVLVDLASDAVHGILGIRYVREEVRQSCFLRSDGSKNP